MPVETDTERKSMLADFGDLVIFSPGNTFPSRNDNSKEITAIIDKEYFEVGGGRAGVASVAPGAIALSSDVEGAVRGSMLEEKLTGLRYRIENPEPDGTGFTELRLEGPM